MGKTKSLLFSMLTVIGGPYKTHLLPRAFWFICHVLLVPPLTIGLVPFLLLGFIYFLAAEVNDTINDRLPTYRSASEMGTKGEIPTDRSYKSWYLPSWECGSRVWLVNATRNPLRDIVELRNWGHNAKIVHDPSLERLIPVKPIPWSFVHFLSTRSTADFLNRFSGLCFCYRVCIALRVAVQWCPTTWLIEQSGQIPKRVGFTLYSFCDYHSQVEFDTVIG